MYDLIVFMENKYTNLTNFKWNKYSQFGEDGIIKKCLDVLPNKNNWCVEFGAWDGKHLSNTRNLIESYAYKAVLIEGNKKRARELIDFYCNKEDVIAINAYVGWKESDNLDSLLRDTPIKKDYDFLSIDIDGNDYYVWKSAVKYKPKLVCIEYNGTIPPQVEFVQPPSPKLSQGVSLKSLVKLAKSKGYELVATTESNAFFVDKKYYSLFNLQDNSPEVLQYKEKLTYIFSGQDGTVFLRGFLRIPCHEISMHESSFQCVPRLLRRSPADFNIIQKGFYALWLLLREPESFIKTVRRYYPNFFRSFHNK